MDKNNVTLEQVEELMNMLTGEGLPEGMVMAEQPDLSCAQAFSVVWFLQEHLTVLPDHFEMCSVCSELFDTRHGGFTVDGTDIPSLWHEDHGVTQEMLAQHDGFIFCSEGCEYEFWLALATKEKVKT